MRNIFRFASTVSMVTAIIFAFIEWQVPGFVSNVFPFYWILVVALVLNGLAIIYPAEALLEGLSGAKSLRVAPVVLFALALSLIVLEDGGVFGVMQTPLALIIIASAALLSFRKRDPKSSK